MAGVIEKGSDAHKLHLSLLKEEAPVVADKVAETKEEAPVVAKTKVPERKN